MRRIAVIVLLLAVIVGIVCICAETGADAQGEASSYLRVHIRANSNGAADQAVKYEVRDAVVEALAPVVASCEGKEEAISALSEKLNDIERVAERTLAENGFFYGARADIRREEFPTRVYDGVTLPAGVYDALILELGAGEGDNWWCVVYPPLCFTGGQVDIVYRSKIAEIVRRFFA